MVAALILILMLPLAALSQKFSVEKSSVVFFSDAAIEDITASNSKTAGLFDAATNEIVFSVPIREFKFAKSLMQEHFNEKYMESDRFPKSLFEGKLSGFQLSVEGTQQATADGKLTIHGVTRSVSLPGTIEKKGDRLVMKSKFVVKLEDYKIEIPQLLWQNIAEQIEVTVNFTFKPNQPK